MFQAKQKVTMAFVLEKAPIKSKHNTNFKKSPFFFLYTWIKIVKILQISDQQPLYKFTHTLIMLWVILQALGLHVKNMQGNYLIRNLQRMVTLLNPPAYLKWKWHLYLRHLLHLQCCHVIKVIASHGNLVEPRGSDNIKSQGQFNHGWIQQMGLRRT